MAGYQWSEFWHGGTEAVTGIGHLLWDYSTPRMIIDHDGVTDSEVALAKGLGHEITHPIALVKSLTDYDTLTTSPARFAGHLIPDLIAAAATAGTATAATRTAEATARAADAAEAATRTAKAADAATKTTEEIAADTAGLEARANALHSALDPIAQNSRTTAALRTKEGQTVLAGGGRDLSPTQRALIQDGEIIARSPGAHAEVTAVTGTQGAGLTPQGIGVSRPICPNCQAFLEDSGATMTSPTTAWWSK